MTAQEYLDKIIDECKVFALSATESKQKYMKLFPEAKTNEDISKIITEMDDNSLREYFQSSQSLADIQNVFAKVASFIQFCKILEIELDLSKVSEVENLTQFISVYQPFDTDYIVSENSLKEKDKKRTDQKFEAFKQSISTAISLTQRNE